MHAPSFSQTNRTVLLLLAGVACFLFVFLKNAWVAEDAYILFRSVEQLYAGNGPRWNVHERVQVFTSPLWFWVVAATKLVSSNLYLNVIFVSLACLTIVLAGVWHLVDRLEKWLLVVALMLTSNAYFDYTSSGLENPLGYVLLIGFLCCYYQLFKPKKPLTDGMQRWAIQGVFSFAGLLLLYRHDAATLAFLPTLYVFYRFFRSYALPQWIGMAVVGLLPFIGWTLFSVFYYGTPFPNTAYAKLNTGVETSALWTQGLWYLIFLIRFDKLTALVLFIAVIALAVSRSRSQRALAAGMLMNVAYIIHVGGDFMQGRFFSLVYLMAIVACVVELPAWKATTFSMPRVTTAAVGFVALYAVFYTHTPLNSVFLHQESDIEMGIADERGFYWHSSFPAYVLHRESSVPYFPNHPFSEKGYALAQTDTTVAQFANIGFMGYWSDLDTIILDTLALSDPLLARLPIADQNTWRIGHFPRAVPEGYRETLRTGEARLADPDLNAFYQKMATITQGEDLFAPERLRAIFDLNLGRYDHHLEAYLARQQQTMLAADETTLPSAD